MRVKYQTRTLSTTFSTNGGTPEEHRAFLVDIVNALYEMGAPLDLDQSEIDSEGFEVMLTGSSTMLAGELYFNEGHIGLGIYLQGRSDMYDNYAESNLRPVGDESSVSVCIHAVKSGDSFFFGLIGPELGNPTDGCISYAITPMRRLSDPSVNLGYAIVEGASPNGPDELFGGIIIRTLPYIEGFNYAGGMLNFITPGYTHAFPEVETGKVPLIPYYAGIEDIYYDKVYISPMKRGKYEEKAFETDKGVFLIGGEPGIDHTQEPYNTLAFDITEAVESAQ